MQTSWRGAVAVEVVEMASRRTRMGITVEGLPETRRVLRALPAEARDEARRASRAVSEDAARWIQAAAATPQQRLVAGSVRPVAGQIPGVLAGGGQRVTSSTTGRSATAGDVFFGAEFGGRARPRTRQFPSHRGRTGYFLWPTLRARTQNMFETWARALDEIAERWGRG